MQIHDFLQVYESKSDEELLLVARDFDKLTPEARAALQGELSRRGLKATTSEDTGNCEASPMVRAVSKRFHSTGDFIAAVTRIYREHFWLFMKLTAPAVILGYCSVQIIRPEVLQWVREALRSGRMAQGSGLFQISVISQATYFLSWLLSCVSYAGISSAVKQISTGAVPDASECFNELGARLRSFLKALALLYVLLGFAYGIGGLSIVLLWTAIPSTMRTVIGNAIVYVLMFFAMLVLSRFALVIPAVLHNRSSVRKALFLSDALTEGKWTVLAVLILKSVWGGYVAALLPFWIAAWTGIYSRLNPWVLPALSVAGVIIVEPFMLIGFSLIYVRSFDSDNTAGPEQAVGQPT